MTTKTETIEGAVAEYVTAVIGGQLFGLPISRVQDVFMPERLTRVPLASSEIAGVLNLRGRIVTVVEYVTALIGGQLFGLPISRVQDVFMPERLTRVPLASSEIAGVLLSLIHI